MEHFQDLLAELARAPAAQPGADLQRGEIGRWICGQRFQNIHKIFLCGESASARKSSDLIRLKRMLRGIDHGSFITNFVRDTLNALEHNKRDCMPSGHTQIVLIVLYLAYRYEKFLFYLLFPIIGTLIASTIYLRYHYVVDLLVGATLAIGCMVFGPRLYQWWNVKAGARNVESGFLPPN